MIIATSSKLMSINIVISINYMKLIHSPLKHLAIPWMLVNLHLSWLDLIYFYCLFKQKNVKIFIAINYLGIINN